jgi:hypothetical protein
MTDVDKEVKEIHVVEEKGPDGVIRMLFINGRKEAEDAVEKAKKFWGYLVEKNKCPERTYKIKRYILDE